VIVTHAFLRSLALLDLAPSVVGALRRGPGGEVEEARSEGAARALESGTRT
jgi:hypothetical protein